MGRKKVTKSKVRTLKDIKGKRVRSRKKARRPSTGGTRG